MEEIDLDDIKEESEKLVDAVYCPETSLLLPSAPRKSKTAAERQRECRLRRKQKILNEVDQEKRRETLRRKNENQKKWRDKKRIINKNKKRILNENKKRIINKNKNKNIDKPAKRSRAAYQREYRLRKKNINVDLNSDFAEVVPRQEAVFFRYLAPSTTAQSTQLSPDAGPIIIQQDVIIETERLPTMKRKESTLELLENVRKITKLKRIQQHTSRDHNFDEICQFPSLPELTPRLQTNEIEQTHNQPEDFSDGDDCEYLKSAIERECIRNEDGIIVDEESISGDDSNHLYFGYRSHQSAHKLFRKMFVKNSFGHVSNVCDRLWFLQDLKSGSTDGENLLKQITEESEDGNEEEPAQAHASKPKRIEQKQSEAGCVFGVTDLIPDESGTEDKYDIHGRYVALKVRQLDKEQRQFVERIIDEALYEGQMGTLNMNSQLVVNTETFVYGQTNDGGTTGIGVTEIKVEKEDCTRVKVEMDLEDPEDVPSEYEDVMDDQSSSLDGAALDCISDHCSGAKRRRLEESDETIESHLVDASNIKAEVITEDDNNLLENCGIQLNTTRIVESDRFNNAKRKRLLETEDAKSFSEPHLGEVKVELDVEENRNPLDAHLED